MAMIRILLSLVMMLAAVAVAAAQDVAPPQPPATAQPATPVVAPGNPYSATVAVAGTNDAQRNAAIASALVRVLQQVSPGFSADADTLANASGYVRDFHYQRAASGNGLQLQVDFDPGAIGRLLAANQNSGTTVGSAMPAAGGSAATAAKTGSATLWVDGIVDSRAFVGVLATLRGDDQLHAVTAVAAQGDGIMLSVGLDQPLATVLAQLTAAGGHLALAQQTHPGADASLHWTP